MNRRSEKPFPMNEGIFVFDFLKKMWKERWLDDFSDEHFLIRAMDGRLKDFYGQEQVYRDNVWMYPIMDEKNFPFTFLVNFSTKMSAVANKFGEHEIRKFVENQLSAGKRNYSEEQFFRAMSELSVLFFYAGCSWKKMLYEPKLNGKKNPEVRFVSQEDVIVDIEVKTPGFHQENINKSKLMPTVLLTDNGRLALGEYCKKKNMACLMPRIRKLKDFINSAAEKFETPKDDKHLNLLYINWSYSEFAPDAYMEPYLLLTNPYNGIIRHKEIGVKLGVLEEAYEKISAIIVYSDSLNGLVFMDLRHIWAGEKFRMIEVRSNPNLWKITHMNPHPDPDPDAVMCVIGDEYGALPEENPIEQAIPIIGEHILTNETDSSNPI